MDARVRFINYRDELIDPKNDFSNFFDLVKENG